MIADSESFPNWFHVANPFEARKCQWLSPTAGCAPQLRNQPANVYEGNDILLKGLSIICILLKPDPILQVQLPKSAEGWADDAYPLKRELP